MPVAIRSGRCKKDYVVEANFVHACVRRFYEAQSLLFVQGKLGRQKFYIPE